MATKNNPGAFDCYAKAAPDEPMFVLLGRDKHAGALVSLWALLRRFDGEAPDVVALKEMAENKLAAHCGVLTRLPKSEGGPWAWAKPAGAMPPGWQSWPRMELGRRLSIKDRESVGCVVSIDAEGRLQAEEGIYWKDEPQAAANVVIAKSDQPGDDCRPSSTGQPPSQPSPILAEAEVSAISDLRIGDRPLSEIADVEIDYDLSPRLQQQLAEQLQAGLAKALEGRNDLGLPLLLAGIAAHGDVIAIDRVNGPPIEATAWPFEEALERYAAMDLGGQLRALAGIVSMALRLTIASGEIPPGFMPGPRMLMKVMRAKMGDRQVRARLVEAFDLDTYVRAAPKPVLIGAIAEACGDAAAAKLRGQGIAKVRAFAVENLRAKKWLPPELWSDEAPNGGRKPEEREAGREAGRKTGRKPAAKAAVKRAPNKATKPKPAAKRRVKKGGR